MQPIALLSPAVGTANVGDHFIETAIRRLLAEDVSYQRFSIRAPLGGEDVRAINACQCALLCGTNLYQHDWESAFNTEALARVRVPVIPFGVGGSARRLDDIAVSALTRQMILALHARCTVGGVRDPHGMRVVAAAGARNCMLTGCPVLFWAGQDDLPLVRPIRRNRLVITARNWLMHCWPDNVDNPVQVRFLRAVVDAFRDRELLFVPHEEFDERLIEPLGLEPGSVFRGRSADDYVKLYTDSQNVVLAMRLHAGMLGLANGAPAVFVGHDTRTYSFCDLVGLRHVELFSETAAQESIERLGRIMNGQVSEFDQTAGRFRPLRAAMQLFLDQNQLPARRVAACGT